jgi:nucleotide-binding universal stress UspA family protein
MFKKILIPVDLQETKLAQRAIEAAVREAQHHAAELHVMTVVPDFGMPLVADFFPNDAMKQAVKKVASALKSYVADNVPKEIKSKATVAEGNAWEQIVRQANKVGADLIVIPPHDRKRLDQILLGSCAAKVLEHAHCSVLVIRPKA